MALSINVSKKAAESRSFEDLPQGWYHVIIGEVELRFSSSEKNPGKPMYGFEFEVTDDPRNPSNEDGSPKFAGRRLWTNACLWEGAEFTIVNILRALGHEVTPGDLRIPDVTEDSERDELVGQYLMVRNGVSKKERAAARLEKRDPTPEVTGFKSAEEGDAPSTSTRGAAPAARRRALA